MPYPGVYENETIRDFSERPSGYYAKCAGMANARKREFHTIFFD